MRSPRARTRRGEQTGWKGVCEPGDVRARTCCHTKPWFRSCRAEEKRGGACIVRRRVERPRGAGRLRAVVTWPCSGFSEMPESRSGARYSCR